MGARRSRQAERVFTVFFMVAVTFVTISAVSALHLLTAETVAQNETLFMKRAVCEAAGLPAFSTASRLIDWYDACVTPVPDAAAPRYLRIGNADGRLTGYVFVREGVGLWGTIAAVCGLDPSLAKLTGVTFVKHNETPGLGARISEDWFRSQLKDKTGPFTLVPEKTRSADPGQMDQITGATITSRAVRDILNTLLAEGGRIVGTDTAGAGSPGRK